MLIPRAEASSLPRPGLGELGSLLGEFLDSRGTEVLESDVWVSAPQRVIVFGVDQVARGGRFLEHPQEVRWRFFVFLGDEGLEFPGDEQSEIVGFLDGEEEAGHLVPARWCLGEIVFRLMRAARRAVRIAEMDDYVLSIFEVRPLHVSGIWLSPSEEGEESGNSKEWLIFTSSLEGLEAFEEYPRDQAVAALVKAATERIDREKRNRQAMTASALKESERGGGRKQGDQK